MSSVRERLHVDFIGARLQRRVGDPASVWRERRIHFEGVRDEERLRLSCLHRIAPDRDWNRPEVKRHRSRTACSSLIERQVTAVAVKGPWNRIVSPAGIRIPAAAEPSVSSSELRLTQPSPTRKRPSGVQTGGEGPAAPSVSVLPLRKSTMRRSCRSPLRPMTNAMRDPSGDSRGRNTLLALAAEALQSPTDPATGRPSRRPQARNDRRTCRSATHRTDRVVHVERDVVDDRDSWTRQLQPLETEWRDEQGAAGRSTPDARSPGTWRSSRRGPAS